MVAAEEPGLIVAVADDDVVVPLRVVPGDGKSLWLPWHPSVSVLRRTSRACFTRAQRSSSWYGRSEHLHGGHCFLFWFVLFVLIRHGEGEGTSLHA